MNLVTCSCFCCLSCLIPLFQAHITLITYILFTRTWRIKIGNRDFFLNLRQHNTCSKEATGQACSLGHWTIYNAIWFSPFFHLDLITTLQWFTGLCCFVHNLCFLVVPETYFMGNCLENGTVSTANAKKKKINSENILLS